MTLNDFIALSDFFCNDHLWRSRWNGILSFLNPYLMEVHYPVPFWSIPAVGNFDTYLFILYAVFYFVMRSISLWSYIFMVTSEELHSSSSFS